jgi:hypothetical protein
MPITVSTKSHAQKPGITENLRRRLFFIALAMALTLAGGPSDSSQSSTTRVRCVLHDAHDGDHGGLRRDPRPHAYGPDIQFFRHRIGVIIMLLAIGAMTQIVLELELNQFSEGGGSRV